MGDDVEKAKRSQQEQGHSSEQDTHATQTLSRQEIISMVKKRFGLKPGGEIEKKPNGIQEDTPVRIYLFSVITKGIFHFWCHWKMRAAEIFCFTHYHKILFCLLDKTLLNIASLYSMFW